MAMRRALAPAMTTIVSLAGHLPPVCTDIITRFPAMLNGRVESAVPPRNAPRYLPACGNACRDRKGGRRRV